MILDYQKSWYGLKHWYLCNANDYYNNIKSYDQEVCSSFLANSSSW